MINIKKEHGYYQDQMIKEEDLMMISESDVFITTDRVLKPLDNLGYKAWVYWVCDSNGNDDETGHDDAAD